MDPPDQSAQGVYLWRVLPAGPVQLLSERQSYSDLQPDLQSSSIGQNRRLTNLGLRGDLSYVKGIHDIKAGVTYEDTILTETDSFALVDPTLNPVCLNADGTADTAPDVTNPAQCTGVLTPSPGYDPLLATIDLTRLGAGVAPYTFRGHADIRELALYVEDTINLKNWTVNLGIRGDIYKGFTKATQAEPRVGIAYNVKPTNTVLRISYARTLETPFNETLVLASTGCNNPVVNSLQSAI